jgi:hypothetical protein
MYFVAGKCGLDEYIGEAILMQIFVAGKVNAVQVADSAVGAVASDEPRSLDHFFRAVSAADCGSDRIGAP